MTTHYFLKAICGIVCGAIIGALLYLLIDWICDKICKRNLRKKLQSRKNNKLAKELKQYIEDFFDRLDAFERRCGIELTDEAKQKLLADWLQYWINQHKLEEDEE